jgi:imidazoleglycerol-phosphate dehydratase
MTRQAKRSRNTKETSIDIAVDLDGSGHGDIATGIGFFDHMLDQLARHGGLDLTVHVSGDLHIDTHHTVEDTGILLGTVLAEALGDKAGVRRFASIRVPLDEALVDVALDLSGRPYLHWALDYPQSQILYGSPPFDAQLAEEFFRAVITSAGMTLHV